MSDHGKKTAPGRFRMPFMVLRLVAMAAVLLLGYQAARMAVTDLSRQQQESAMVSFRQSSGTDAATVLAATRSVVDYPVAGLLAEYRADGYGLLHYAGMRAADAGIIGVAPGDVLAEYRLALDHKPTDGYLWARYGLFLSYLDPLVHRSRSLQALDRAMSLSPRDYNTMRVVADIGVRLWHEMTCDQRGRFLLVLDRAGELDDRPLNQWITRLGQPRMRAHLDELFRRYRFNPQWARASVLSCEGG